MNVAAQVNNSQYVKEFDNVVDDFFVAIANNDFDATKFLNGIDNVVVEQD